MRSHHLINQVSQRVECPYCHNKMSSNQWDSCFDLHHHYKESYCEKCMRTITIKVHFDGSGHDCWDKNSEFCKLVGGVGPSVTQTTHLEDKIKEK